MKTKLLIASLLFCSMLSFGQVPCNDKPDEKTLIKDCNECCSYNLIYDFKCKKFYYKNDCDTKDNNYTYLKNLTSLKVKYKEGIRFKIVNLNRYLYEASVSYDDVILTSEEPQILKSLFQGSDFDFKLPVATKAAAVDPTKGLIEFHGTPKGTEFFEKFKVFKDLYNDELKKKLTAYSLCQYDAPCCKKEVNDDTFTKLSKSLLELKIAFFEYKSQFAEGQEAKLEDFKKMLDSITDDTLLELVHFGNNVVQANYEYISPTIYPTGDRLSLNLKISPNTSDKTKKWQVASLDSDEFSVEFRVRNKWFFSFSTGPFIGFSDNFRVDKYGWQKIPEDNVVDADSKYKIKHSGREGMPVGIAGFANLGTKLTEGYGLGVSIGAGATILDEARLAYFAGITQFFGQDKQFNLTLGVSFMQVKELDKGLYPDNLDDIEYDAPIDLEYTKKFVSGVFASVSYTIFNPSNKKKGGASSVTTDQAEDTTTTETTTAETDDDAKGNSTGQTKKIVKSKTVRKKSR